GGPIRLRRTYIVHSLEDVVGAEHGWKRVHVPHEVTVFGRVIRIVEVDRFIEREGKVRGRHVVTPTEVEQVHHRDEPSGIDLGDSGDADGVLLEIDTERTRDVGAKGADGRRTYVAHLRFVHRLG